MALEQDVVSVRLQASVPLDNLVISDPDLILIVEEKGINGATSYLWTQYASTLTGLVDVSESGSSRKLSDLLKNALAMAKRYTDLSDAEVTSFTSSPTTRAIVRP